jgi:hypothetical protein
LNTALTPQQKAARLRQMQQASANSVDAEVLRIVNMPTFDPLSQEDIDAINWFFVKPEAYARGFRLFPKQAEALCAFVDCGGLFGPVPVGEGKTLIGLLIADYCYREAVENLYRNKGEGPAPRGLLLVPPQVLAQLRDKDVAFARANTRFDTPVHYVGGVSKKKRLAIAGSRRRGLYVTTYSLLSADGADEMFDAIAPTYIIADEAHNVSGNKPSARAKRFRRYVDQHGPKIIALSGTLTNKSPMDYHYLAKVSLKENNFMPNSKSMAEAWSMVIDTNAGALTSFKANAVPQAGPLLPMLDWARGQYPDQEIPEDLIGFRKSYYLRLSSTPGVVTGSPDALGASLVINNLPVPPEKAHATEGWDEMQALVKDLTEQWLSPGGDEIEHAMHIWKWRYEIEGAGFYNDLYWPEPEVLAKRKSIELHVAKDIIDRSIESHSLQQIYAPVLRKFLQENSKPGLDTPRLLGQDMHLHGAKHVPQELFHTWEQWKESEFPEMIARDARAVRVCPYKINHCVDFVKHHKGGVLVWYIHQAVGAWITEALQKAGIEAVNCMAGDKFNKYLSDSGALKGKVLCLSLGAHGTGKNLQHGFDTSYYLQWPRSATLAEQSIGRTHRKGQLSDEVDVNTCISNEFDKVTFAATLNDTAYQAQTLGGKQKLLYAVYNPIPEQVPFTVLQEWGTQPKNIDDEARRLLSGLGGK